MNQKEKLLAKKTAQFPTEPGVYLMKDQRGEVIYIGKAKDLRARVRSYFKYAAGERRLITEQIEEVDDIDVVVAGSEKEALILENNFIKQFRPKYNVLFRDDKSFVSIKIRTDEPWPRPVVTRRIEDEGAVYFGPYASAKSARKTLRVIQDVFPLRKCSLQQCRRAGRPCVYGQMGKCLAPCMCNVSGEEYAELLEEVKLFLRGKNEDLIDQLRAEMKAAAEKLNFEKAARIRDRIEAVEETLQKQQVASSMEEIDRDIFGLHATEDTLWVAILFVRSGNLQDVGTYHFSRSYAEKEEVFRSFLNQFYSANRFIPEEILLPVSTEDSDLLKSWLSEEKGRKVKVACPQRGAKKRLVELANRNAREAERISSTQGEKRQQEIESLRETAGLENPPRTIECFDISNLQGHQAVGSMVAFRGGAPVKDRYRRYKIREVEGQDDFAMMREVVRRRYRHVAEQSGPVWQQELPDLIVLDGGIGQLNAGLSALEGLGIERPDMIGLAKARVRKGEQEKGERIFLPGQSEPINLAEETAGYRLVTRVRDEAHRFAISYHRTLRRKGAFESPLMEVSGIGQRLAGRIIDRFKTLQRVAEAGIDELAEVKGVSERLARRILEHMQE
ncbi:MAG: excinuclease ABC subunit UvrC [Candidatus Brocadiia bacterium]